MKTKLNLKLNKNMPQRQFVGVFIFAKKMKQQFKKAIIRLANRWQFNDDNYAIQKIENGYIFHNKYYENLDDMRDDFFNSLKKFFD